VIITSSSNEKLELAKKLGADKTISYDKSGLGSRGAEDDRWGGRGYHFRERRSGNVTEIV